MGEKCRKYDHGWITTFLIVDACDRRDASNQSPRRADKPVSVKQGNLGHVSGRGSLALLRVRESLRILSISSTFV